LIELNVNELRPDQALARTVYRPSGDVLLTVGFKLTEEVIAHLSEIGQSLFWIQEPGLEHIIPEEIMPDFLLGPAAEELRANAEHFRRVAKVPDNFDTKMVRPKELVCEPSRFSGSLNSSRLIKIARGLAKEFRRSKPPFLLHFTTPRSVANYPFQHAVDTAIVAAAIGRIFQFDEDDIENLVLGTMLMDIGMQLLPLNLTNKSDRMSFAEFSAIKEHPMFGFEILRNDSQIPLICAHIAFQHHERQDGGGYPRRLIGRNASPQKSELNDKRYIHRFAEIVSVADEYMMLAHAKPFQPQKSPLDAIKFLLRSAGTQLNSAIIDTLIPMIPVFSVGNRVQVIASSKHSLLGATAVISKTNPERQDRPEITLIYDAKGNWIEHEVYHLAQHPGIAIQQI